MYREHYLRVTLKIKSAVFLRQQSNKVDVLSQSCCITKIAPSVVNFLVGTS